MKLDVKQGKGYSQKWTSVMFVASALLLSACRMGEELFLCPIQEVYGDLYGSGGGDIWPSGQGI